MYANYVFEKSNTKKSGKKLISGFRKSEKVREFFLLSLLDTLNGQMRYNTLALICILSYLFE